MDQSSHWMAIMLGALTATCLSAAWSGAMVSQTFPKSSWVRFESFTYSGTDPDAAKLTSPRRQYLNPILAGFYPDPSICRVGDDFYLVNSSFCNFPGIPIFHSKDLVDWTQIGYALDRPSQFSTLKPAGVWRGVYAPTIRWREGTFYVINTLVNGGGNYFVTAKNPAGPWSEPHWLNEVDGIDPSFFFDDDGRAFIVFCAPPPDDRPLYPGHRTIRIRELDLKTGEMTGAGKIIVNGGTDISKHPIWIEGPHIFKRGGRYYLIAAEGGTEYGHSEVIFRANSLWGPYEPFAGNPILTQRDLPPDRPDPVTCSGHADFVETPNGQWWSVFLACQPYEQNFFNTGRETFLLPVTWEDGWPIILKPGEAIPRVVNRPDLKPQSSPAAPQTGSFSWTDDFARGRLGMRWNFLRVPTEDWYSLSTGHLLIAPRSASLAAYDNPSFIACRQQHATFSASTTLSVNPNTADCDVGLAAFQNERHFFFLGIRIRSGSAGEVFAEQATGAPATNEDMEKFPAQIADLATAVLPDGASRFELKIQAAGRPYSFFYRIDGGPWIALIQNVDGSVLSTETASGFQGVMLGMYARSR